MTERAKIRRGQTPRNRPRPTVTRRGAAAVQATRKNATKKALATIPMPAERLKDIVRKTVAVIVGAGLVVGLWVANVPQMAGTELGKLIGAAGFSVKRVEIQGIHHMDRLPVYSVALDQTSTAMPLVDLSEIRDRLLKFGWVSDARVSRRLPDTLLVDIVEREPAAIWQYQGRLALIDKDGVTLQNVDPRSMPDLPIVVGPGANMHATDLNDLLATAPRLKPMFAGATWIGDRRWDVRFQTGETLSLPEGADKERAALAKFDRVDQSARLLGQGYAHIDMRLPYPRDLVVRVSKEPGHQVEAPAGGAPQSSTPVPAGTDAI